MQVVDPIILAFKSTKSADHMYRRVRGPVLQLLLFYIHRNRDYILKIRSIITIAKEYLYLEKH
jgi:hypothetical protein